MSAEPRLLRMQCFRCRRGGNRASCASAPPRDTTGPRAETAGTAQKVVLNTLSTSVMIALGSAYGPRRADGAPTPRCAGVVVRIVRDAAGVDKEIATAALAAEGGHAKTAIVALLAGGDVAEAAVRLDRVRAALGGT